MKKNYSLIALFIVFSLGCKKNETYPCQKNELRETAVNMSGTIVHYTEENVWAINHHFTGTIDAGLICFVCNMPNELKVSGKEVIFSGTLYATKFSPRVNIAGKQYRTLETKSLMAK